MAAVRAPVADAPVDATTAGFTNLMNTVRGTVAVTFLGTAAASVSSNAAFNYAATAVIELVAAVLLVMYFWNRVMPSTATCSRAFTTADQQPAPKPQQPAEEDPQSGVECAKSIFVLMAAVFSIGGSTLLWLALVNSDFVIDTDITESTKKMLLLGPIFIGVSILLSSTFFYDKSNPQLVADARTLLQHVNAKSAPMTAKDASTETGVPVAVVRQLGLV
jgi:hypothetical protein